MKMKFSMVLQGKDDLEEKFQQALKDCPNLHMQLIRAFGQAIMMGLRLGEDDNIQILSFTAGKYSDEEPKEDNKEVVPKENSC